MRVLILSAFLLSVFVGTNTRTIPITPSVEYCQLPENGAAFSTVNPSDVNLDPVIVQKAITYASTYNRLSV